jgi:hypothetical protein
MHMARSYIHMASLDISKQMTRSLRITGVSIIFTNVSLKTWMQTGPKIAPHKDGNSSSHQPQPFYQYAVQCLLPVHNRHYTYNNTSK